jgi:Uma2 family endonuclease
MEYDRMVELGFFDADERVELLDGVLVQVSPHGACARYVVRRAAQVPFAASEWSEPEPDIAVVRNDPDQRDHPSEVLLLVEISDSTLRYDRKVKQPIYANAHVPEYWIVNVDDQVVEVFTQPRDGRFERQQVLRSGDVLRPALLEGVAIAVADLPW